MKMLKVGITGSPGFIGSHLVDRLRREEHIVIIPDEKGYFEDIEKLKDFVSKCDVVVHLAAMNRGEEKEIYEVNLALVKTLTSCMEVVGVSPHVIFASSTQSMLDNPYGRSKKEGCKILEEWALRNKASLSLLTIPNVYGDSCKPFYNSVVATFCYQLTHRKNPTIKTDRELELIYINELTENIYQIIKNPSREINKIRISGTVNVTVSKLLSILENFRDCFFKKKLIPVLDSPFLINLYNVFLSYLDYKDLCHSPEIHSDHRGELYEIIKLSQGGQVFFSTTKSGVVRGNHYHTRKLEKFCVLQGEAVIRLRRIGSEKVVEYNILADKPRFVEIPIFHTHSIENVGSNELYTLFWSNELLDPDNSDTYYEEVHL